MARNANAAGCVPGNAETDIRAVGRNDEHVGIAHQLERLERPVRKWGATERKVEVAALDRSVQLRIGRRLRQAELDRGPVRQEPAHDLGQDAGADALIGADAQRAGLAGAQRCHVGAGCVEAGHDRFGVAQEQRSRLGHRDRTRSARSLDEPLVDDPLEGCDLLADGRLCVAELGRRASEGTHPRDGLERREVTHLNTQPMIRFCNDCHENLDLR